MSQEHSIEKYTVNITASRFTNKEALYRNIEQSKEKILEILDEVFSDYFPASADIEISRIHLDLGLLPEEGFSETMAGRVKQLLTQEVGKILVDEEFKQHIHETSKSIPLHDPFVLLGKFLDYGFNAELQSKPSFNADQYVLELLEKDSEKLGTVFREKIHHSKARKRIQQLKAETLRLLREKFPDIFLEILQEQQAVTVQASSTLPDFIISYLDQPTQADPMIDTIVEVELRNRWQEHSLNPSVAYQLSLAQLQKLVPILWRHHSTFQWWLAIQQKTTNIPSAWNTEKKIRHLYFIYLGLLQSHQLQSWTQARFESLMAEGLYDFVEKENTLVEKEGIETILHTLFPEANEYKHQAVNIPFSFKGKRTAKVFRPELPNLLQYGSPEEIQLYVEYYLEDETAFYEWFYEGTLRYELLARVWEHLSLHQLERMLPVLLKEDYNPVRILLNELRLFLKIQLPVLSSEQTYKQSILTLLETLHQLGSVSFYETISKDFISRLWREELSVVTGWVDPVHFPTLSVALNSTFHAKEIFAKDELPVTVETFGALLLQRFQAVSSIVISYLTVLNRFLEFDNKLPVFLPVEFYKKVYQYLLQNEQSFSEIAFVYFTNQQLAFTFALEKQKVVSSLLEIINTKQDITHGALFVELLNRLQQDGQDIVLPQEQIPEALSITEEQLWQQTISIENYAIQRTLLRATFTYFVEEEKFPEDMQKGLLNAEKFRRLSTIFIRAYRKEFITLFCEVVKDEKSWQFMLSGSGKETGVFLLKKMSGAQYEELNQWKEETIKFISFAYPALKPSVVEGLAGKAFWNLFLKNERHTGLLAYLEQLAILIKAENEFIPASDFTEIILRYQAERNVAPVFLLALRNFFFPFFYGKKNSANEERTHETISFLEQSLVSFLGSYPSPEAIRLYFDYHLSHEKKFRQVLVNNPVSIPLMERVADSLTETQLSRFLPLVLPEFSLYLKEWLKEWTLFMHAHHLGSESERVGKKLIVRLIVDAQDNKSNIEVTTLTAHVLNSLLVSGEELLEYMLTKELYWNTTIMQERYPKVSRSFEALEAKNVQVQYKTDVSPEYGASLIAKQFPGTAVFVQHYISILKAVPLFNFGNKVHLADLYRLVHVYLSNDKNGFSEITFVKEITALVAANYSIGIQEAWKEIFATVQRKIQQGDTRFLALNTVLNELGYETSLSLEPKIGARQETHDSSIVELSTEPEEIMRLIDRQFPSQAGFVLLYKTVLEHSSLPVFNTKVQHLQLYSAAYSFLKNTKENFSASMFVNHVNLWVASNYSIKMEEVVTRLLASAVELIRQGFSMYETIKELLEGEEQKLPGNVTAFSISIDEAQLQPIREEVLNTTSLVLPEFLDPEEVKLLLQKRHPSLAGFVSLYMKAAEDSSLPLMNTQAKKLEIYIYVYNYLEKKKDNFSANGFVKETTANLATYSSFDQKTIGLSLLKSVETQIQKGNVSFEILRSILVAQGYESPSFVPEVPLMYLTEEEKKNIYEEIQEPGSNHSYSPPRYAEEIRRVIDKKFPALAGFVLLYVKALEKNRVISFYEKQADLYLTIYAYLLKHETDFSSITFVKELTAQFASIYDVEQKQLGKELLKQAIEEIQYGNTRFEVLKEILLVQEYETELFVPYTVSAITTAESQLVKNEIGKVSKQLRFELFRKAIGYYIQKGTIPELDGKHIANTSELQHYLRAFFYEYKGELLPLLKELIGGEQVQKQLAEHKDDLLRTLIFSELSENRYEEFMKWNLELEAFLLFTYPFIDPTKLLVSLRLSLLALLLQRDRITVGLFSYLEQVFRQLKNSHTIEPGIELVEAIEKYKQQGRGLPLLMKALERMEMISAQNERRAILEKIVKGKFREEEEPVLLEGRIPIKNAGIVLAGPFLYRYFDRLAILKNQNFKTPELACRAVQLLQFLATGSTEMQEQDLLLNKVLCGVPLDTVLEPVIEISEEEIEISESLLRGILANWEKLKTNSIDSLREGFLMREGWLEQTELGWELEVERKAMDILVDLIPWSFNLIKLGWMEASLTTKWKKSLGE